MAGNYFKNIIIKFPNFLKGFQIKPKEKTKFNSNSCLLAAPSPFLLSLTTVGILGSTGLLDDIYYGIGYFPENLGYFPNNVGKIIDQSVDVMVQIVHMGYETFWVSKDQQFNKHITPLLLSIIKEGQSFKPILDLFESSNIPLAVQNLLELKIPPKIESLQGTCKFMRLDYNFEMYRQMHVGVIYMDNLISVSMNVLTPAELEECRTLIHKMGELLYVPKSYLTFIPCDGDMFIKHSQRIFEILGKDFGWHEICENNKYYAKIL